MTEPTPEIALQLRRIQVLSEQLHRQLARSLGVNSTDLSAVEHLLGHGPMTAGELAHRMDMSTAATTHVIDRLSGAGHVRRSPHPDDRRKVRVEPEPASVRQTMTHLGPIIAGVTAAAQRRTPAEQTVIAAFLGDVVDFYTELLDRPD